MWLAQLNTRINHLRCLGFKVASIVCRIIVEAIVKGYLELFKMQSMKTTYFQRTLWIWLHLKDHQPWIPGFPLDVFSQHLLIQFHPPSKKDHDTLKDIKTMSHISLQKTIYIQATSMQLCFRASKVFSIL